MVLIRLSFVPGWFQSINNYQNKNIEEWMHVYLRC